MLELSDALNSHAGREFLAQHGVTLDPAEFVQRLKPPHSRVLGELVGPHVARDLVVYSGQQIYSDYRGSVVAKMRALQQLGQRQEIQPFMLWLDTDRSGSDKATTTIRWPTPDRIASVSLAARSTRASEIRFVETDPELIRHSWQLLGSWLAQSLPERHDRMAALARHESTGARLEGATTLAEVNSVLTSVMLKEALGLDLPCVYVSDLATRGVLSKEIEKLLDNIGDFVAAFNEGIGMVTRAGFNPHVHPLQPDYLPLFFSCPYTNRRVRLLKEQEGAETLAVGACSAHGSHRFALGRGELSLGELEAAGRWSPDVTLPLLINNLVSGVVAGRSSALYGIVLGIAQQRVFGTPPYPVLVPKALSRSAPEGGPDSLLYSYLTGSPR